MNHIMSGIQSSHHTAMIATEIFTGWQIMAKTMSEHSGGQNSALWQLYVHTQTQNNKLATATLN